MKTQVDCNKVATELYLSYFGRHADRGVMLIALQGIATEVPALAKAQGPSAAQARREQIRRNGGKR